VSTHYTYLLLHLAAISGPLVLSFDKKVHFYKKWRPVFFSMFISGIFFVGWDEFFTRNGIWGFNNEHIIGIHLGSLPLEEVLFFITVPYCCLFVYECIRTYFPKIYQKKAADYILIAFGLVFFILGIIFIDRVYSAFNFLISALFIGIVFLFRGFFKGFDSISFLVTYAIIVIPFLIINGILTAVPVIWYNDAENVGVRIFSFLPYPMHNIPLEDIFYCMLLLMVNIVAYEKIKNSVSPQ
jgi:lycopene cyclase domain-containing protein